MPMTSVIVRPGVNSMMTLAQNEAGVSASNLMRYQQGMIQKQGGWVQYYPFTISSTIKELFGWQGLAGGQYLAVGATQSLSTINSNTNNVITPQTFISNVTPDFSVSSGSNIVTVVDPGSSMTVYNSIYFNTPVAVGGLLLNGAYRINTVGGSSSYTIISSNVSSATVTSSGILAKFTTSSGNFAVTVELPNNNFPATPGLFQQFIAPTSVGGLTIEGPYQISSIIDSTSFVITATTQASSAATVSQNNGLVQIVHNVQLGAAATGTGYGIGGYGLGGYGTGVAGATGATGTPITATDWSLTNWGDALLACPYGGPIYVWSPSGGFTNAGIITEAPAFNGGIFVSQPQQILVAWGSVQSTGVRDPLTVRWSDILNYTQWSVTPQTYAGSFRLPSGSVIKGGIQSAQQGIIWTDIECWVMQYVGQPAVFNFTKVGSGCGLVGMHAAGVLSGTVYWMGRNNFFSLTDKGVTPLPCSVWNYVFQNIDMNNLDKVRCATNTMFNEVTWFFPASGGNGENSLYVKLNQTENEWDYGVLGRSAWIDVTVLGNPISADTNGFIYQHEIGYDNNTLPMQTYFESGYWAISDGNDMAFVDWIMPDMQFGTFAGNKDAILQITFKATDYPGDTPRIYGPYSFTQATEYINTRIRGRLMAIRVESQDAGSFYRLGRIRYRWAPAGRR